MMNKPEDGGSEQESGKRVVVVGAGNGGCKVLARLASGDCACPRLVCLGSQLPSAPGAERLEHFAVERAERGTSKTPDGPGTEALKQLCAGADLVIVVAGLGGGLATGVALSVFEAARARGVLTLCFAMLPFEFEGMRRRENARRGLDAIDQKADCVICLPSQRLFKGIEQQLSVADAFKKVDEMVARGVYAIWRGLCGRSSAGGVELGFDDLRALIAAGGGRCVFACADAEGATKVEDVVKEIAASPMLKCGKAIENAAAAIVNAVCGTGVSVFDMNRIIAGTVPAGSEGSLIKTGIFCDPDWGDRVSLLVIVSEKDDKPVVSAPPPAAEPKIESGAKPAKPPAQREKLKQQNLFDSDKVGRFKGIDPTIVDGNNLDIPTFIRRGILVRRQR